MICEVVAVGTELLLGPNVDTNSTWIGERLAENGINSYFHTVVGDNRERIVEALRLALSRADAVVVTGGLGPTQDDITRQAIADVMGVELERDARLEQQLREMFAARKRVMSESNLQQALLPVGATPIDQVNGTAPGLICPVGPKVVYAVPGVPFEMQEMVERAVLPDLRKRAGETGVILSRVVRTWGLPESVLAETIAPRLEALDVSRAATIAFLARGIEGIHVRITARADSRDQALEVLDAEESEVRALAGSSVFGVDAETMEFAVGELLKSRGWTLAVAESMTGGLIASRLTEAPGSSEWFRGGVVSYATDVKYSVLHVPEGPVVTPDAALAMARGVRDVLGSSVGLGITGVAGPARQEGQPVGTVFGAVVLSNGDSELVELHLNGDRQRIREYACINLLDRLRRLLLA